MRKGSPTLGAALCALTLSMLAAPSSASAAISFFNCVSKPPSLWCDGKANGSYDGLNSWDYAEGWNPGSGQFIVCERIYRPATGKELYGSSCAVNWVGHYYGAVQCNCYEAHVLHQASGNRNINGHADSDF